MKQYLRQILEEPNFVKVVQSLDSKVLAKLIDQIGLEDAGELVAMATTEQLSKVFDEDLWKNEKPGTEERFDGKRFGIWIQILLEMGPSVAAKKIVEMDPDFVASAFGENLLVLDMDELITDSPDDLLEKAMDGALSQEIEEFLVFSRNTEAWDALLTILLALDEEHTPYFRRLMETLAHVSHEYIDDNGGLYQVLTAGEKLQSDVAFDRERRREKAGFVPPLEAAAFFKGIEQTSMEELLKSEFDPLAKAHLREVEEPAISRIEAAAAKPKAKRLLQLMTREMPSHEENAAPSISLPVAKELALLATRAPKIHTERMKEMSFLANALVSGMPYKGRRYRPSEAAHDVVELANAGLEHLGTVGVLEKTDMVKLFKIGWKLRGR